MATQRISENQNMILGQMSILDKPDVLKANQANMLPEQLVYQIHDIYNILDLITPKYGKNLKKTILLIKCKVSDVSFEWWTKSQGKEER